MKQEMKKLTDDTLEAYKEILTPDAFRVLSIMVEIYLVANFAGGSNNYLQVILP